jgi:hypothetical protein
VQLSKAFFAAIERERAQTAASWLPNYSVARKLHLDSSALGRITAACRVAVGGDAIDIGLGIRAGTSLCVPDMAQPSPDGAPMLWLNLRLACTTTVS